ncbi:MAG: NAD-dependent epimerase/dehydratase family protein [Steroidobacteraceae bacterium]
MKQRVLILGATGFISRRIVNALAKTDWATPVAASRRIITGLSTSLIETIPLDATDETALTKALAGVTSVVNCVAGDADTIVLGAKMLFSAAGRMASAPRIVHMSSLAAYGSVTGAIDESTPLLGDLDAYSKAKATTEQLGQTYPNLVTLRPGIVYGPESPWWSDRIARLLCARRLGDLGDVGNGFCNLVHVDDVVTAAIEAVRRPGIEGQAFNLSCPTPPTWNEYFAMYGKALGVNPIAKISRLRLAYELKLLAIPLKAIEVTATKLKRPDWHPTPPLRPWLVTLCQHEIQLRVHKAENLLGLHWTPLPQGLQQTAAWFLAGGRT